MKQRNLNMKIVEGEFTGQKTNQKFEESEKGIERSRSVRRNQVMSEKKGTRNTNRSATIVSKDSSSE